MSVDKVISKMPVSEYVDLFNDIDQLKQAVRVLLGQDSDLIDELKLEKENFDDFIKENEFDEMWQEWNSHK